MFSFIRTKVVILLLMVLFIPAQNTYAAKVKPLPYSINAPRLVKMRSTRVLLEWYQPLPYTIVVYKLSSTRSPFNNCSVDVETFQEPFCKVIFTTTKYVGNIRIIDNRYRKGDQYYILQYAYQTHNGAYGPFIPK